jgi:hypothetical protein
MSFMDLVELTDEAVRRLEALRTVLLIDPFFKIEIEISRGDFYSECVPDPKSPLAWTIRLNSDKHESNSDINYSIVEGLLKILMSNLIGTEKEGVISRLATSYSNLLEEDGEECSDTVETSEE